MTADDLCSRRAVVEPPRTLATLVDPAALEAQQQTLADAFTPDAEAVVSPTARTAMQPWPVVPCAHDFNMTTRPRPLAWRYGDAERGGCVPITTSTTSSAWAHP